MLQMINPDGSLVEPSSTRDGFVLPVPPGKTDSIIDGSGNGFGAQSKWLDSPKTNSSSGSGNSFGAPSPFVSQ